MWGFQSTLQGKHLFDLPNHFWGKFCVQVKAQDFLKLTPGWMRTPVTSFSVGVSGTEGHALMDVDSHIP